MLRESRQKEILNLLNTNGYVEISSLCKMFQVTETTIRRDLDMLAEQHPIERTRGGAIRSESTLYTETGLEHRMKLHSAEKLKIAEKALEYISNGNTVYFDSGSTSFCIAQSLPNDLHLVADSSKIDCSKIITYASLHEMTGLIIDDGISEEDLNSLVEHGANVILA